MTDVFWGGLFLLKNIKKGIIMGYKEWYIVGSVLSIVLTMIYINYMNYALDRLCILDRTHWRTLTVYLSGMLLFFVLFVIINLLLAFVLKRKFNEGIYTMDEYPRGGHALDRRTQWIITIILTLIGIGFLWRYFFVWRIGEPGFNSGVFNSLPIEIWKVVGIVSILFCVYMIVKKQDVGEVGKYFAYAVSILIVFFTFYIPNPFIEGNIAQGHQIGFLHFNISGESIYNVLDGVPYTLDTTPLYGHYALFFFPVKLVGNMQSIHAIPFLFAVMACIEHLAMLYVIDIFVPKNWIGILLAVGGVHRLIYYAPHLTPIRTLFPIILFAFFVYLYKKKIELRTWFGYLGSFLILTLSVLFNLEIGICCIVGFCSYIVFELVCEKATLRVWMVEISRVILICVLVVASAICIVNIYNLACGGPIILQEFFFPIIGGDTNIVEYIQDHFYWPVPRGNYAWEYILIFLLGTFCATWFMAVRTNDEQVGCGESIIPILGGMTCLTLAAFSYYMNEPLWTDLVVYRHILYGMFAIVIGKIFFMLEKDEFPSIGSQFVRVIGLLIICVTVFGAIQIINDPVRIAARKWEGAYDTELMKRQIARIEITEDVYGFGQGVNMIYHMLGIDNHMKYRDTTELDIPYFPTFEKVVDDLKQKDIVFINTSYEYDKRFITKLSLIGFTFTPTKKYQVGNQEYSVCRIHYNAP